MTSILDVQQAVYTRFAAQWTSTGYTFDNEVNTNLDAGAASWAHVVVREAGGGQETLGGVGSRKFWRSGIIFVKLYTPIDGGVAPASTLAEQVRTIFEGANFSGVYTNNTQVRHIGPVDGRWYETMVTTAFNFEEQK